jgi:hypothetical protein
VDTLVEVLTLAGEYVAVCMMLGAVVGLVALAVWVERRVTQAYRDEDEDEDEDEGR